MNAITGPPGGGFLAGLSSDRVTRGTIARWSENAGWTTREGQLLPSPMLVLGYVTVLRRWQDKQPKYDATQPPRDPELLNSTIPPAEWEPDLSGNPRPPWAYCYVIYMVNLVTGRVYTFAHDTYGTLLCYQALEESCAVMQLLRGANVLPIVQLGKAPWKSARWGMQMRPHLEPIEWRDLSGGGGGNLVQPTPAPQLNKPTPSAAAPTPAQDEPKPWEGAPTWSGPTSSPAPSTPTSPPAAAPKLAPAYPPAAQSAAAAAAKAAAAQSPLLAKTKPVKPITVAESIADELPSHSAPPKDDKGWR